MRFTDEQWHVIASEYNAGRTIAELALLHQTSVNTVIKHLPRFTRVRTTSEVTRIYSDEQITDTCQRYQSGLSAKEAGKIYGISEASVFRFLSQQGINRRHAPDYGGNSDYFNKLDSDDKLYWFGFILADGSLRRKRGYIVINLGLKDRKHLEQFKVAINYTKPLKIVSVNHTVAHKIYQHVQLNIGCARMWKDLKQHGILRLKKNDPLPLTIFTDVQLRHILRGFFDGDGSLYIRRKRELIWRICGHSKILEFFRNYLIKMGVAGIATVRPHGSIYYLTYGGNCLVSRICEFMYKDVTLCLERKHQVYKSMASKYKPK